MPEEQEEKKRVVVSIFDREYVVRSHEEEEDIKKLAAYLDQKMRDIKSRIPQLSANKVAVLTALNLTAELFKVQEEYEGLVELIEETKKR